MRLKTALKQFVNGNVYLQAPLKAFELDDRIMEEKYGLIVRELDYHNDSDIEIWKSIIHTSYDDCHFTTESAKRFLSNHTYMTNTQTFVFQQVNGVVVATVSIGLYKNNPNIGGDFRIAVTKKAQNQGYGRLCVLYAFSKLASLGVKNGESAIAFKRKESLHLHYSLGFRPQYNAFYLAEQNYHPWLKNLNFILKLRLLASYHGFLIGERRKYRKEKKYVI